MTLPHPPKDLVALSTEWNEAGRAYYTEFSERLARFYRDGAEVDLTMADPRPTSLGDEVLRAVVALNASGELGKARELFDPAFSPLMPSIEGNRHKLGFVAILGPDELLVHRGSPWKDDGTTFHLRGGVATPIPDVHGLCRSRSRDHLVFARTHGLEVRDARAPLDASPVATIAWPDFAILQPAGLSADAERAPSSTAMRFAVEQIDVSDDGMRIVVSCYRQGILLASRHADEPTWQLLHPDARPPYGDGSDAYPGDMTHVAIARDGTRLAWGSQDRGHFLAEVKEGGAVDWYATVGHLSEYPHYAYFSDDGGRVALNSCHFYQGATIAFGWDGNRGVTLEAYEEHEAAPVVDGSLRVYAATFVPKTVLDAVVKGDGKANGAFVLAGAGILRIVTADGSLAAVQGFGASAGSIDYCPESRRLAVASYSGMVHLYDPNEEELPGRIDGYRARKEVARWLLWESLPSGPVRW